jgi:hypothetical protein
MTSLKKWDVIPCIRRLRIMAKTKSAGQGALLGGAFQCPEVESLPLISDPQGHYEVFAPGSVYQPVLLTPQDNSIKAGPGVLNPDEERFVRDLIRWLYPANNPPRSEKTPLKWEQKEIWLKRNIDKAPRSFRLRVDDSDWFYPDFILWILDYENKIQTFGFVDPKGLLIGSGGGWADPKVVCALYMPHVVELQLGRQCRVQWQGEPWQFRIRGVLLSVTPYEDLQKEAKFYINHTKLDKADFERGRIVFQDKNSSGYIKTVLDLLVNDNAVDDLLRQAAQEYETMPGKSEIERVAELLRDWLKPDDHGKLGVAARAKITGSG